VRALGPSLFGRVTEQHLGKFTGKKWSNTLEAIIFHHSFVFNILCSVNFYTQAM
jgi:hypothetical protein